LSGAQAHRESAAIALGALTDDGGAADAVNAALGSVGGRGPFAELSERLRGVVAELIDIAAELRDRVESIDDDPAQLAAVVERRQLLRNLRRKYGETLADVIVFQGEIARPTRSRGRRRCRAFEHERVSAVGRTIGSGRGGGPTLLWQRSAPP
jgi:DNA repair protein RecN (Recombination protein N)